MNLKLIKTEEDYQKALKRLEEIFDAEIGTPESDEADILGLIVDEYEQKHYPTEAPDPYKAIKIRKLLGSHLSNCCPNRSTI